ncbi:response regulator [Paradesulfitobacterium ferrireducens]|uniref:response regulator n=1 Tax=Paradesulfitobacterium ferrireducens TaxID=2816476 RepID=UPI001A8C217A|nr:response regulator [Paradesulfitobacterium ferrireducens]
MEPIDLILVEDDPMVMAVNEGFIEQIGGFQIIGTARSGAEGLDLIQSLRPRLVLLDIYLPDMDGVEVLKEIRRCGIPTDFIMITAAHDVKTVQDLLRSGVVDYIIKPFKCERLKLALEKYRHYLEKLNDQAAIGQEDLDALINSNTSANRSQSLNGSDEDLPKGLRTLTLNQVLKFLSEGGQGFSAEEVAEGVGLARVTARRYLEYLEKRGKVRLESRYGSVGRPVNRYKVI